MAMKIVQVTSEANAKLTITAFTRLSAERNIDHGDNSGGVREGAEAGAGATVGSAAAGALPSCAILISESWKTGGRDWARSRACRTGSWSAAGLAPAGESGKAIKARSAAAALRNAVIFINPTSSE